jgi:hypothetical protein
MSHEHTASAGVVGHTWIANASQPQPNSVGGQGPTLRGQDSQEADAGEDDRDGTMAIPTPSTNVAIVCATSRRASGRLMPGLLLEGGRDLVGGGGTPRCSAAHA